MLFIYKTKLRAGLSFPPKIKSHHVGLAVLKGLTLLTLPSQYVGFEILEAMAILRADFIKYLFSPLRSDVILQHSDWLVSH